MLAWNRSDSVLAPPLHDNDPPLLLLAPPIEDFLRQNAGFAGYSVRLSWQSYTFHDVSTSNDATPLWIPQLAMALGAAVMAVAFIDEAVLELSGRRQQASAEEALHHE